MSIDTDYATLRHVLTYCQPKGWAIEFGVYSGYSLGLISEHMPVIGLDSFEGLPEDWREGFPKGAFNDENILLAAPRFNSLLAPGLFEDTLPPLLERGLPDIGLIHIDCDLYSSTVTALEGMCEYIKAGTIIVFDEFHGYPGYEEHEFKAWTEFCDEHRVLFRTLHAGDQELAIEVSSIGVQ